MRPARLTAVLALLAVASCGTEGPTSQSADEAPTSQAPPPGGWRTTIPADLPLDAALPEDGGDFSRGDAGVELELCGRTLSGPSAVASLRVSATGPEYSEAREVRVFADDRAARRLLADIEEAVAGCARQGVSGTTWLHDLRPSALVGFADAAYTVVRTYRDADGHPLLGATFWEVARVGNAVLLTATSGEYDATMSLDPGIREHVGGIGVIVESLCVFAADPCDEAPRMGGSPHRTVVTASGLGGIALGDPANLIEAFGGEVTARTTGSGCRLVELWVNEGPDLSGNLDPDLGLAVIQATQAVRTDRGVGIGSPHPAVVAAYPRGEGDEVLWSAPAAGYDDRHWRFWFDREGRVDEFMLLLDAQHCGG